MAIGDQGKRHCDDRIRRYGRGNGQRHSVGQEVANFVINRTLKMVLHGRLNNMFCPDSLRPTIAVGPIVPYMKLMCLQQDVVENSFYFQINSQKSAHPATITIFSFLTFDPAALLARIAFIIMKKRSLCCWRCPLWLFYWAATSPGEPVACL